ncbi:hypothetical protein BDR07DRAFT_578348 [Suillus spraguei]|nr:hypothetical protein BDR07DRAFT_578348 [Suillus spraguei]
MTTIDPYHRLHTGFASRLYGKIYVGPFLILLRFRVNCYLPSSWRDSTQETHTSSEATPRQNSHRPRGRVSRFLEKVKVGANKLRASMSPRDPPNHSPVPPNAYHRASSTSNIELQVAPSGVEVEANTRSTLLETQEAIKYMHPLFGPAISVDSALQGAQEDLNTVDSFQDTYLKPLRIFDDVIGKLADVHPYAKMALGILSWQPKLF